MTVQTVLLQQQQQQQQVVNVLSELTAGIPTNASLCAVRFLSTSACERGMRGAGAWCSRSAMASLLSCCVCHIMQLPMYGSACCCCTKHCMNSASPVACIVCSSLCPCAHGAR
jgi:hypothetical protein